MARLSIRASRAWLGPGRVVDDAQIVTQDGAITYAGVATPIEAADREIVIDGFLMPAAADRHVHIELSDPAAVLAGGVTAVRDLAWPPDRIFPLADLSELPTFEGPADPRGRARCSPGATDTRRGRPGRRRGPGERWTGARTPPRSSGSSRPPARPRSRCR